MQKTPLTQASTRRERQVQRKRKRSLRLRPVSSPPKGFLRQPPKISPNEADIGESTLYNYFDSKREIMLAIMDDYKQLFDADFHEATALLSREAFVELVDKTIDVFTSRVFFIPRPHCGSLDR